MNLEKGGPIESFINNISGRGEGKDGLKMYGEDGTSQFGGENIGTDLGKKEQCLT